MQTIKRDIYFRNVSIPQSCGFLIAFYLMFFLGIGKCNATYVVSHVSKDGVIIEVDSRQENGADHDDNICKISVPKDHIAVTLIGNISVPFPPKGKPLLLFATEIQAANLDENPIKAAEIFTGSVVNLMNSIRKEDRTIFGLVSWSIFAGFDGDEPKIFSSIIAYATNSDNYVLAVQRIHEKSDNITLYNYAKESQDLIEKTDRDAAVASIDDYVENIKQLIERFIQSHRADNVGGVPTVLIMEKDRRPRWFAKAPSCPTLE